MTLYTTSFQHILAELERIDLLIQAQVWRARQIGGTDDDFQGLYISEQELDTLLAQPIGMPRWATAPTALSLTEVQAALARMATQIAQRKAESLRQGIELRLERLARLFQLTPFDVDALLICLAPELDLRYERLYAYLQDDVTKKRPSVDLVLNLLSPSFAAKMAARQRFSAAYPLRQSRLLQFLDDPAHAQPPLLSRFLQIDERVVNYLLDTDEVDARLTPFVHAIVPESCLDTLVLPAEVKRRLGLLIASQQTARQGLLLYFQGPYGVGKQITAEALSRELDMKLLVVRTEYLSQHGELQSLDTIHMVAREALLQNAVPYWTSCDSMLCDDQPAWRHTLLRVLHEHEMVAILSGGISWEPTDALLDLPFVRIEFPVPTYAERVQLWARSLENVPFQGNVSSGEAQGNHNLELHALANKFRLSGGQIRDAAVTAYNLARWRNPEQVQVTMEDLLAASRLQSNRKLAELAQKITPHYGWDDIVLPRDEFQQLREICNHMTYRSTVYDGWGFDRKLSLGKGLNVLFAGPSGTGKTMAAEIIAGDLGLDLYKIDLSTVVSKYIGETEKNLSRIFSEAESSNAILFFDEADALFGKRSEVRDAHDRYANVEISYLLQRMEAYEGIVILATNLRKNMDDAFVRRLHFTVEFPFPGAKERRRIWEKLWPEDTPRSPALDLDFMSRRLEIAGGNIRNIALAAAFLAADDGQMVAMNHLIHAAKREYQKMGKVMTAETFAE